MLQNAAIAFVVMLSMSGVFLSPQNVPSDLQTILIAALTPGAHVRGPSSAPLTLEEFSDLQCPDSKQTWPVMKKLIEYYGPNLRYIRHHLPLPYHRNAFDAAQAAEVTGEKGKFWEMVDLLFENQEEWNKLTDKKEVLEKFAGCAAKLGIERDFFMKGMENRDLNLRVRASWKFGAGRGMNGTPSFAINGVKIQGEPEWTVDNWKQVLDPLLAQYKR
ncbi:MAG TPA: thioredoxin domain-containing protein [Acidobacteriota bacterium]|jgi:protein-disulfide isomerase|nr:thioredoxin domain-containing protein [Acidobacteriota bacterium]